MLTRYFVISIAFILSFCSPDNKPQELSRSTARELVEAELNTPIMGGSSKKVDAVYIKNIKEENGIYIIEYTWSGGKIPRQRPGDDDEEEEEFEDNDERKENPVENASGSLKVKKVNKNWEIVD